MGITNKEYEQRWLVLPNAVTALIGSAHTVTRMIQAYVPETIPTLERSLTTDSAGTYLNLSETPRHPRIAQGVMAPIRIALRPEDAAILQAHPELLTRMRLRYEAPAHADGRVMLTIKGDKQAGGADEIEYAIPLLSGLHLMTTYGTEKVLAKRRYHVGEYEVDCFDKHNDVIAEREVADPTHFLNALPEWAEKDITDDKTRSNYALSAPDPEAIRELQEVAAQCAHSQRSR